MPKVYAYAQMPASPLGRLWVAAGPFGLAAVGWEIPETAFTTQLRALLEKADRDGQPVHDEKDPVVIQVIEQLTAYFDRQRRQFELPIDWEILPDFQRKALAATFAIPYGATQTYGQIAATIGHPGASRAVGRAEATNPMPVILPCHRVIGSDGKLHGYAGPGGLDMKRLLLNLEKVQAV